MSEGAALTCALLSFFFAGLVGGWMFGVLWEREKWERRKDK